MFQHNKNLSGTIRIFNELFNRIYIKTHRLHLLDVNSVGRYHLVWLKNIKRSLKMLPLSIDHSKYHFCDVGCGTGIALHFVMSNYDFLTYSGFDINESLIDCGINFFGQKKVSPSLTVSDAAQILLKKEPTVYFLFNPFSFNTMSDLIINNYEILRISNSIFVYVNDIHINELLQISYGIILVQRNNKYNISILKFGEMDNGKH